MRAKVSLIMETSKQDLTVSEFKKLLPPMRPVIGLDIGSKTIGVAASDATLMIATPVKTITRTSFVRDMEELGKYIAERNACALVSGLPLETSGKEGERAKITRMIGDRISEHTGLPIFYWDERFSSKVMERFMISEADLSRKKRKEAIDRSAAAYILQGFLDAI